MGPNSELILDLLDDKPEGHYVQIAPQFIVGQSRRLYRDKAAL